MSREEEVVVTSEEEEVKEAREATEVIEATEVVKEEEDSTSREVQMVRTLKDSKSLELKTATVLEACGEASTEAEVEEAEVNTEEEEVTEVAEEPEANQEALVIQTSTPKSREKTRPPSEQSFQLQFSKPWSILLFSRMQICKGFTDFANLISTFKNLIDFEGSNL